MPSDPTRLTRVKANLRTAVASMTRDEEECLKQMGELLNSNMNLLVRNVNDVGSDCTATGIGKEWKLQDTGRS